MINRSIITLLTDFGVADEYVGVMKGVILSVNPSATIIDISHQIDPQDLVQAAYFIKSYHEYFPKGTVHVVVVDPGVGSDRAIIALEMKGYTYLVPDNGVLTLIMEGGNIDSIICVDNSSYFLGFVSQTFHGRDIFAPVAAQLSMGGEIKKLGTPIGQRDLVRLSVPKPFLADKNELVGTVVSIDHFGNLITNIDLNSLEMLYSSSQAKGLEIMIGESKITGLSKSYNRAKSQKPLAIIGSRAFLEIAVNGGSARRHFMAEKGDTIRVVSAD